MSRRFQIGDWVTKKPEGWLNRVTALHGDDAYILDRCDAPVLEVDLQHTHTANHAVAYPAEQACIGMATAVASEEQYQPRQHLLAWLSERVGRYETIDETRIRIQEFDEEMRIPAYPDVDLWHVVKLTYEFPVKEAA